MAKLRQISLRLPESLAEWYGELEHGQKQLACGAGLLMYLQHDEETQWIYREWARAISEGRADRNAPPPELRKLMPKKAKGRPKKKRG